MGTIRRPSDSGSRGTNDTDFIQCVDGREQQIHKLWCLSLDGISHRVHPIAHVKVTYGTVVEFLTNHFAEYGCRIKIIWKISVNDSIQFLDLSNQSQGCGLPFIYNLLDRVKATRWGSGKYSNQDWGGSFNYSNSIADVAWGASVNHRLYYLPHSIVNP